MTDTIFALATAPGKAAVAVMRLSGPQSRAALLALAPGPARPRRAAVRALHAADGALLDRALVLWFPGPASYTGEDCVELHLHGGPAVIDTVTQTLLQTGLRLAEPGEFTRRAFEHGKLDLDQAEAIGDLIDAESSAQARQALGQARGRAGSAAMRRGARLSSTRWLTWRGRSTFRTRDCLPRWPRARGRPCYAWPPIWKRGSPTPRAANGSATAIASPLSEPRTPARAAC